MVVASSDPRVDAWQPAEPGVPPPLDLDAAIVACAQGERFAWRLLCEHGAGWLLAEARRIVRDEAAAQLVLTAVCREIWRQAGTFQPQAGSARAWLAGLLRHAAQAQVRRRPSTILMDDPGRQRTAEDALARMGRRGVSPSSAAWMTALLLEGQALDDLARQHGASTESVRADVRRGLRALWAPGLPQAPDADDARRWLAAEYALGSLAAPLHDGVTRRLPRDRRLQADVQAWHDLLWALVPTATPVPLAPDAWAGLSRRLALPPAGAAGGPDQAVSTWWHGGVMRVMATLTAGLCIGLGLLLVWGAWHPMGAMGTEGEPGRYMAVLNGPQEEAAWVIVGTQGERLRLTPLNAPTPVTAGQRLTLWVRAPDGLARQRVGEVRPDRATEWSLAGPHAGLPELTDGLRFELRVDDPPDDALSPGPTEAQTVAQGEMAHQ